MRFSRSSFLVLFSIASLVACGGSDDSGQSATDAGGDTASGADSAKTDSTSSDSASDTTTPVDSVSSDTSSSDGSSDTASSDTSSVDSAGDVKGDAPVDAGPAKCTTDGDCRTFSVECEGKCECIALASSEKDPTCPTPTECFADPCAGKTAHCGPSNVCVVG